MSFLSDTDVNKRVRNLFVSDVAAAVQGLLLRSTVADMQFFPAYDALFPGAVELGGTWDAGTLGTNGTLSAGDTVAAFTGTGSVAGSSVLDFALAPVAWEVEVLALDGVNALGSYRGDLTGYDSEGYDGNAGASGQFFSSYYESTGQMVSYQAPVAVPALAAGDVLGLVMYQNLPATAGSLAAFVNGVYVGETVADAQTFFTRAIVSRA